MKLIYRGVRYSEERHGSALMPKLNNREIIYRGNSSKAKIKPDFPWIQYIRQLFGKPELRIVDPITFWYNHKRKFIEDCWRLDNEEKLALAWDLTLKIERAKALNPKQKTKLKYRGVTYYK